jgi:hypothetical protein
MESFFYIALFVALLGFARYTEVKTSRYTDDMNLLLRAAKRFGDKELTCFRFFDKKNRTEDYVWALVDFDARRHDVDLLFQHGEYFVLEHVHGGTEKRLVKAEHRVRKLLSSFPYEVGIIDAGITFEEYKQKAEKVKEIRFSEELRRQRAKNSLKPNIMKFEKIVQDCDLSKPEDFDKLYLCLSDILHGIEEISE